MLNLQAYSTTWVQIGDYEYIDKDNIIFYVNDYGTVQYSRKSFWVKIINDNGDIYKDLEKEYKQKVSYVLEQIIIDTARKSFALKTTIFYDEQGKVILSSTKQDFQLYWATIAPNTRGEFFYELVSKPKILKKIYKRQLQEAHEKFIETVTK